MELYELLKKIRAEGEEAAGSPPPGGDETIGEEIPASFVLLPEFPEGQTPLIRVYAWAVRALRFGPVDDRTARALGIESGEMDGLRLRKLAVDLKISEREVHLVLDQLVREGDLMTKTEKRGRRIIYWLAPLRY